MKGFSRFLKILATGSSALLLSACYGAYMPTSDEYTVNRKGSFKIVDSQTEEALKGIRVSYKDVNSNINYSNDEGLVNYNIETSEIESLTVYLKDVDESENGKYPEPVEKSLDDDDSSIDTIKLESVQ